MSETARLRMFAGPNGSGKSTIKSAIRQEILGIYINPDEIEKEIKEKGFFNFDAYGITTTEKEIFDFLDQSSLLKISNSTKDRHLPHFENNKLVFHEIEANAYFAAAVADFIRNKLVTAKESFTFETVMSHPDKINLLRKAQITGYRTYLYYVATEDPGINISRIRHRIKMGGHPVPEDKIISRYHNSLELLLQAVQNTHRAYIFDNSGEQILWLAQITNGNILEMKTDQVPLWFKKVFGANFNF